MSDPESPLEDSLYSFSVERDNRNLATEQVRKINTVLRRVRRLNKDSQRMQRVDPGTLSSEPKVEVKASSIPNVVEILPPSLARPVRRPSREDDATEDFLIPEPTDSSFVASAFRKAFEALEKEELQTRRKNGEGSAVVKTWKLL